MLSTKLRFIVYVIESIEIKECEIKFWLSDAVESCKNEK